MINDNNASILNKLNGVDIIINIKNFIFGNEHFKSIDVIGNQRTCIKKIRQWNAYIHKLGY